MTEAAPQKPFRRSRSRTIRVPAVDGLGEAIMLEVQAEEWRHPKTGRYRWMWSAREVGRLSWDTASSPREALRRAAFLPAAKRPSWLTAAVKRAQELRCD